MYCKKCGTVNPEMADYCLKCGRNFGEAFSAETEEAAPIEIALAAGSAGGAYGSAKKSIFSPAIVAVMAAGLIVMAGTFLLLARTGDAVYHPKDATGATPAYPNADSSQSAAGVSGGMGLVPGSSATALANDAVRKNNALRLQTAVAQFYAENDRYPDTITEIPSELLGFQADSNIYSYSVRQDPPGFRIEVIMEGNNISGGNIVTEGEVTKYIYEGQ